jgi:hypothetical protein
MNTNHIQTNFRECAETSDRTSAGTAAWILYRFETAISEQVTPGMDITTSVQFEIKDGEIVFDGVAIYLRTDSCNVEPDGKILYDKDAENNEATIVTDDYAMFLDNDYTNIHKACMQFRIDLEVWLSSHQSDFILWCCNSPEIVDYTSSAKDSELVKNNMIELRWFPDETMDDVADRKTWELFRNTFLAEINAYFDVVIGRELMFDFGTDDGQLEPIEHIGIIYDHQEPDPYHPERTTIVQIAGYLTAYEYADITANPDRLHMKYGKYYGVYTTRSINIAVMEDFVTALQNIGLIIDLVQTEYTTYSLSLRPVDGGENDE